MWRRENNSIKSRKNGHLLCRRKEEVEVRKEGGKQNWVLKGEERRRVERRREEGRGGGEERGRESDILGYREVISSVERINTVVAFIAELSRKWSD